MIPLRARTIAIIGAGPSGVTAAKYLRAEKAFDKIVLYEQRSRLGGIWNHTPDQRDEDFFAIPQTEPIRRNQEPTWRDATNTRDRGHQEASFLSPIYDKLETNIPRGLMGFQDLNWPEESQLFPQHETVLQYILDFSKDVEEMVELETQVTDVQPNDQEPNGSWIVKTQNLRTKETQEHTYDAVIVANGHFIVPYVPDIVNIREWNKACPGAISHSKYFRTPEDFAGKKVVVVGNSASGLDISSQIAPVCRQPLLWSSRSVSMFDPNKTADPTKTEKPPIRKFLLDSRGVQFEDGTIEHEIDAIVFATGYFYSLPFLENLEPALIKDGTHVEHTFQHIFYAPRPTLSFLVLNQRVIPFPMAEAQSAVLARVYSARLPLPPLSEMRTWEELTKQENGSGKTFHLLPFPKDADYINELYDWAMKAQQREGLENGGQGKIPPRWAAWEYWCRGNFAAIRKAFKARGEGRYSIRSLDELGFSYEEYLEREKANREGETFI